jgi:hypothetical protein
VCENDLTAHGKTNPIKTVLPTPATIAEQNGAAAAMPVLGLSRSGSCACSCTGETCFHPRRLRGSQQARLNTNDAGSAQIADQHQAFDRDYIFSHKGLAKSLNLDQPCENHLLAPPSLAISSSASIVRRTNSPLTNTHCTGLAQIVGQDVV